MKKKGRRTKFAGVKALGDGKYRLRVYVTDPETGRQKEKMKTVRASGTAEAHRMKLDLEAELRIGGVAASKTSTRFGDVADAWLSEITTRRLEEDPTQLHLCPSTRTRYTESVDDILKPFFGTMIADRISADVVRRWRLDLLDVGYARSTSNAHHRVLKAILRSVGNTAASEVKTLNEKPGARITRKQPNLLTAAELDRFLAEALEHWPQHYALILVLFTTTMRISTALALRWDDLDLETMEFVVTRRLSGYGAKAEVIPGVKRDRFGEDAPPLLDEVYEALLEYRATLSEIQLASGLLFPAIDGRHHYRTLLANPFKDICARAGITKRFTPHGCRRTGAKLYGRTAGTRIAMDIAGHRTERMHQRYAPVDAEEKQAAGRRAFANLRVIAGGQSASDGEDTGGNENATGTQTGTSAPKGAKGSGK